MANGFRIYDSTGNMVIDDTYETSALLRSGTVIGAGRGNPNNAGDYSGSFGPAPVPLLRPQMPYGQVYIRPKQADTYVYLMAPTQGGNFRFYFPGLPSSDYFSIHTIPPGREVDYLIFQGTSTFQPSSSNGYGILVKDASGKTTFTSDHTLINHIALIESSVSTNGLVTHSLPSSNGRRKYINALHLQSYGFGWPPNQFSNSHRYNATLAVRFNTNDSITHTLTWGNTLSTWGSISLGTTIDFRAVIGEFHA